MVCRKHVPVVAALPSGWQYNVCIRCGKYQTTYPTRFGRAHRWNEPYLDEHKEMVRRALESAVSTVA